MVEDPAALDRHILVLLALALWFGSKISGRRVYPTTLAIAVSLALLVAAEMFGNLTGPGALLFELGNPATTFVRSLINFAGLAAFIVFTELTATDDTRRNWRQVVRYAALGYSTLVVTLAVVALWASTSGQVIEFDNYASMNPPSVLYSLIVRSALAAVMFRMALWAVSGVAVGDQNPRPRSSRERSTTPVTSERTLHVADRVAMVMVAIGSLFVGSAVAANAAATVFVKSGLMSTGWKFFDTSAEKITAVVLIFGGLMAVLVFARCRAVARWWRAWRLNGGLKNVHAMTGAIYPEMILQTTAEQGSAGEEQSTTPPLGGRSGRSARPSASEVMEFNFRRRRAECFDAITRLRPYIENDEDCPDGPPLRMEFVEVIREVADRQILFKDLAAPGIVIVCDKMFEEETRELLKISRELRRRRLPPSVDETPMRRARKMVSKW